LIDDYSCKFDNNDSPSHCYEQINDLSMQCIDEILAWWLWESNTFIREL